MGRHADDGRAATRAAQRHTVRTVPRRRVGLLRVAGLLGAAGVAGYAAIGVLSDPPAASPVRLERPVAATTPPGPASTAAGSSTLPVTPTAGGGALPAPDWRKILVALDELRSAAFADLDDNALTAVYVDGSAPLQADLAVLAQLAAAGLHAVGLHLDVRSLIPLEAGSDHAALAVIDRLGPYELTGASAGTRTVAGRADVRWRIDLSQEAGAWQIASVRACPVGACAGP